METEKSQELIDYIRARAGFWWWVPQDALSQVSVESAVEQTLIYGDLPDLKELFRILGREKVAEIFFRQIASPRSNYHPRTKNFFSIVFEEYTLSQKLPKNQEDEYISETKPDQM